MTEPGTAGAIGALLGAAVGDALGWPQEVRGGLVGGQRARDQIKPQPQFVAWTRSAGHYTRRYPDRVEAGEYSDDTQLLLSVARACLSGHDWYERLTEVELPTWPLYQRGGGGAVLSATGSWATGVAPWISEGTAARGKIASRYAKAGANGVAMRIAPHVICATSDRELNDRVLRDGFTTHGHPRALVGALVYASALRSAFAAAEPLEFGELLVAGQSGLISAGEALESSPPGWLSATKRDEFEHTWDRTNIEVETMLATARSSIRRGALSDPEATLEMLGCVDPKINGAGTVSAVAALYIASRFAARPMGGLITGAFLRKGDTDTLASMTGALLGALHGKEWLGELAHVVQDSEYIATVATKLSLEDPSSPFALPQRGVRRTHGEWERAVRASRKNDLGTFPDGRQYQVTAVEPLGDTDWIRVRIRFADGQTAVHDIRASARAKPGAVPTLGDIPTSLSENSMGHLDKNLPARSSVELVGATVLATDLRRTVSFYAKLLGRDIAVRGDEVQITDWLRIRQSRFAIEREETTTVAFTLQVSDLSDVSRRLGLPEFDPSSRFHSLRDPDGRIVRLIGI